MKANTGLYYYGERYYNPQVGVWLSVDAMADKYPNLSPYTFVANNPVMLVDPDGNWPGDPEKSFNSLLQLVPEEQRSQFRSPPAAARIHSRGPTLHPLSTTRLYRLIKT